MSAEPAAAGAVPPPPKPRKLPSGLPPPPPPAGALPPPRPPAAGPLAAGGATGAPPAPAQARQAHAEAGAADPRQPTPQRLPPQDGVQRTPLRPPTEHRPAPQQPPEPLSQAGAEPHGTWECAGVPQQRTPLRLPPQDGVQRTPLRPPAGEHEPPPRQWPDPPLPRGAEADFADGGRGNRDEQYSEPLFQHDWQQPPARGDCLTEAQARNMAAAEEYEEFLNDNSARFYEQNGRPYWAESKEGEQPAYPGHYAAEASSGRPDARAAPRTGPDAGGAGYPAHQHHGAPQLGSPRMHRSHAQAWLGAEESEYTAGPCGAAAQASYAAADGWQRVGGKAAAEPKPAPRQPGMPEKIFSDQELYQLTMEEIFSVGRQKAGAHAGYFDFEDTSSENRENLQELIRVVQQWEGKDKKQIMQEVRTAGLNVIPSLSREEMIDQLVEGTFGHEPAEQPSDEDATPDAPAAARQGAPPAPGGAAAPPAPPSPSRPPPPAAPKQTDPAPPAGPPPPRGPPPAPAAGGQSPPAGRVRDLSDEAIAREVARINEVRVTTGMPEFLSVLGISRQDALHESLVKRRYRDLCLLIHPDKRSGRGETLAVGKEQCDQAWVRLRDAYERALNGRRPTTTYSATRPPQQAAPATWAQRQADAAARQAAPQPRPPAPPGPEMGQARQGPGAAPLPPPGDPLSEGLIAPLPPPVAQFFTMRRSLVVD